MRLKDSEKHKDDDRLAKLVDSVSTATENCKLITQFILNAHEAQVASLGERMSPAVSIHSLNDTLAIDGAGDRCESRPYRYQDDGLKNGSKVDSDWLSDNVDSSDDESSYESPSAPQHGLTASNSNTSHFGNLFILVKFIVLLSLNIVTLLITAEFVFVSMVYVLTGERYIEFHVDRSPTTWIGKAKLLTFGPDTQAVRIQSFAELFYRDNVVNILKYFTEKLIS